ncbi:hypothetical protein KGF54_004952 [Candida jiufengensis]|uniref:uncharacterized protein n=1 Tax=Candida jiufengensis TaxID=497108 RepID=UPI0022250DA5|nr:uncharacterized protein KGF54_004952 [Candida jiufengensis]KAI5951877.1 hypothetical protein KGF54_004952 [Candida jiufengensis]
MENDISVIIELLESQNAKQINKGLSLLENLLRNLLPTIENSFTTIHASRSSNTQQSQLNQFLSLQDNFSYNLTSVLISIYNQRLSTEEILSCNKLIQGLLLLHPQSKTIFNKKQNMKLILNLLKYNSSNQNQNLNIIISTISTLIHILIKNYKNYRIFESLSGCKLIIENLKLNSINDLTLNDTSKNNSLSIIQQNLNFKIIEFLMFYTIDEIDNPDPKSLEEKISFFKEEFPEIDSLVESLNELINL